MVRGRATGRGTRRGAAAGSTGRSNEAADESITQPTAAATAPVSTPATASSSNAPPRRGAATRGAATARFRPKNVRRDVAERDSLARQEQQKFTERAAEERRARGRSRFRSKRSRGDTMGSRGGMGRSITTASGPFSSSYTPGGSSRSGLVFASGGGGGVSNSRTPGSFIKSVKGDSSSAFGHSSSGMFRETRINADKLHAQLPEEEINSDDEAMMAALSGQSATSLPMGIYRRKHKEAEVVVATNAELEAAEKGVGEEESLWIDSEGSGTRTPINQPEEKGVWDTDSGKPVVVKKEPDAEDAMDIDAALESQAEEQKPTVAKIPKRAIPQDPELKMIRRDMDLLAHELGAATLTENTESATQEPANKDGRLYLFQFPPLLPPLQQIQAGKPPVKVKEDPDAPGLQEVSPRAEPGVPVDLTGDKESGNDGDEEPRDEDDSGGFRSQLLSQGGIIGKLNVRKSGKVELDWGGRTLEMSPAAGMGFVTSAVIVEENDEKPQSGVIGGEGIGMGKIMGRFVLAPAWTEEEEWDVAPEDLLAPEAQSGSDD